MQSTDPLLQNSNATSISSNELHKAAKKDDVMRLSPKLFSAICVVCTILITVVAYSSSVGRGSQALASKNLATRRLESDYPKINDDELKLYRSKKRIIEYSISDLEDESLLMNPESLEMAAFHQSLIDKYGYNTKDHNIQFHIKSDTSSLSGVSHLQQLN